MSELEEIRLQRRTLEVEERILRVLERIEAALPHRYIIRITLENEISIGLLSSPGTASILLALLDNGAPYTPPVGSTYVFTPTLTASDTDVTIAADPTTPDQFDVTIPAGDPSTSVTFTASATAPDGTTATGTLTIPFAPTPQQFSISVTQTA
jgi:hypothetical protein